MAFDLVNSSGRSFRISGGAWAVYLEMAMAFGWTPAGTTSNVDPPWTGRYDTNDGQTVSADDAYRLCKYLVGAVHHAQFDQAISDTIANIEAGVAAEGLTIPPELRITTEAIKGGINDLCMFLTEGSFRIH